MVPFLAPVPCGPGSGPGPGRDVLEGLAQRTAGAERLLVEVGRDADAAPVSSRPSGVRPGASRVRRPDQAAGSQAAVHQALQHLGGHHPGSAGVTGHFLLGRRPGGGRSQPPGGRQQHELSRRSNTCRQPSAAWCSQKPGLISGPRGPGRLAGSLMPNGSADSPWSPGSAGAFLTRDPAATPWPRGSATPSRLGLQRGEAATARRGHRLPVLFAASLPARRWYALAGEGGCLLQSPSRGHVDYRWRHEVL